MLEVGLGGRLDATNVIDNPAVAVITTIDYDHQQYLGDTLTLIAAEKAGILKRGRPAVIGVQPDEARAEIERVAERAARADLPSPTRTGRPSSSMAGSSSRMRAACSTCRCRSCSGRHQIDNAGNAIAAIRAARRSAASRIPISPKA